MSDQKYIGKPAPAAEEEAETEARREFLKTVGKGAVVAPAVAMLLSSSMRSAKAAESGCGCGGGSIL